MTADEYVLDEDEYEILETGDPEPITSEEVKRKLESPVPEVIEQEDFDGNGPTLSDYFGISEDQYPRNISDNKAMAAGSLAAFGLYTAASYAGTEDPIYLGAALVGLPVANYAIGLTDQETDFEEALNNSVKNLADR